MLRWLCVSCFIAFLYASSVKAQASPDRSAYSRLNSFSAFVEYSNSSSPILLGSSRQRKLAGFGFSYSRRLLLGLALELDYLSEVLPVLFESDPVPHVTGTIIPAQFGNGLIDYSFRQSAPCRPLPASTQIVDEGGTSTALTIVRTCEREWTFGQGLSPIGFKTSLRPGHRLQPVLTGLAGYMFSNHSIPVDNAGSFNFTFEIGAGFELYSSREHSGSLFGNRSVRAEYRYHHISNADTANENPGIDNGTFQVNYSFGR